MLVNIIIPIINHDTITGEQQYTNIDISDYYFDLPFGLSHYKISESFFLSYILCAISCRTTCLIIIIVML